MLMVETNGRFGKTHGVVDAGTGEDRFCSARPRSLGGVRVRCAYGTVGLRRLTLSETQSWQLMILPGLTVY